MSVRNNGPLTELTVTLIALGLGAGSGCAGAPSASGATEGEDLLIMQDGRALHGSGSAKGGRHGKGGDKGDEAAADFFFEDHDDDEQELQFAYTKLIIEHNATDEDTGFQLAADGEPWKGLDVVGPDGGAVLSVRTRGRMVDVGLTEMFFETQEPPNAEVPIPQWLSKLPEGVYEFEGRTVDGAEIEGEAALTHAIPAGPQIVSPEEGVIVDPDEDLQVVWEPVSETIDGLPVNVTHYQLIVEEDVEFVHAGFGRSLYSVHVPAHITAIRVPHEFLEPSRGYAFEVLAIEESGNQTLSSSDFETSE